MESQAFIPSNAAELEEVIGSTPAVAVYFSTPNCGVCHALLPKMEAMFSQNFPLIKFVHVQIDKTPDISGSHQVFTAPTLLIFFEGREFIRKARNMGVQEVYDQIERPYKMLIS